MRRTVDVALLAALLLMLAAAWALGQERRVWTDADLARGAPRQAERAPRRAVEPEALAGLRARQWVPPPTFDAWGAAAYVYDPGPAWPLPKQRIPRGWPGWTDSVLLLPRVYSPLATFRFPASRAVAPRQPAPRGRRGGR